MGIAANTERSDVQPGRLETAAVIAFALGFLLPFVGWLAGAFIVLISRVWSTRDKLVGVLLAALPSVFWGTGVVGFDSGVTTSGSALGAETGDDGGFGSNELLLLVWIVSGLPGALYLRWRLRGR